MSDELLRTARAYGAVAGVAAVVLLAIAAYLAVAGKRWLPLERLRPGRWAGYEVFVAFCVVSGLPTLIVLLLLQLEFFTPLLGDPPPLDAPGPTARFYVIRCDFLASPLILALTLAILFMGLYVRSQTRPHHYGLSWGRWPANLGLGLAAFLLATPVVLGLNALITLGQEEEHPFVKVARQMQSWEWFFAALQVVVQAPLLEEILFRGVLLGWLRRASLSGHVVVAAMTLAIAVMQAGGSSPWDYVGPGIFAAVCTAGYAFLLWWMARRFGISAAEILQWQPTPPEIPPGGTALASEDTLRELRRQEWTRANAWLAVCGSAMLFAVGHTGVWPAPVALLPLALALGWLAMRTQSLIAPITLHALFNLVSFLVLYFGTP